MLFSKFVDNQHFSNYDPKQRNKKLDKNEVKQLLNLNLYVRKQFSIKISKHHEYQIWLEFFCEITALSVWNC